MSWFLIAIIAPAFWSITNHLDKYLLSKYFKGGGIGALMIFSSLIGLFLLPVIILLHPEVLVISRNSLLIALNGALFVFAILPYFYALEKDDASVAVPLFQLIPVFSFILAYIFLGETLTNVQMIGGLLVVLGAISISLEISNKKKITLKKEVFWLMMLSSFIMALNFTLFKYFSIQSDFWFTSFWEYTGFAFVAIVLLVFVKPYREEFFDVFEKNSVGVLSLNALNEIINIIAKISFNIASLLAPVAIVSVINGLQPFFVFVYGILLTIFFPKIASECLEKRHLLQKLVSIIIIFIGTLILFI